MILFLIGGLLIGGVAVAFALQNTDTVVVTMFSWHLQSSLALVIMLAMLVGAIVSSLWSLPGSVKKSFQISSFKKQISKLEKELAESKKKPELEKPPMVAENQQNKQV